METFVELNSVEMESIDGGKKSLRDWMMLGGALCCIPLNPYAGAALTIIVFCCTD